MSGIIWEGIGTSGIMRKQKSCAITVSGSDGKILDRVSDAFVNPDSARQFVDKCNIYQLMPVHLKDALEDAIA